MANTKKYVSFDKLSLYDEKIKEVITDGDAATLAAAEAYADGLATNYDAAGAAATVQGKLDEEVARAKAAEEANAAAAKQAQNEVDALEIVVENLQKNAYDDTEVRGLITGLENNKADKTQVATDIAAAVKAEEDARKEAVQGVQDAVNTLSGTHATDKAALEAAIALKADQTALDAVSDVANAAATKTALQEEVTRATGEEARIEGLVTAEAAKAREEEGKLDARLVEVETFFKTAEGETISDALDTLVEIQKYITDEGAAADEMVKDIAANAKAIEDMDAAYKAADATLQGNIDTLSGVVNTKAAASDVEVLEGRMDTAEGDIEALEGRMDTAESEIDALQALFGEGDGTVADMIADAVAAEAALREAGDTATAEAAATDAKNKADAAEAAAKSYADAEIDKVEGTIATLQSVVDGKAAQADLTALTGRVTTAEGEIDTLQSEMDAVEALAAANDAAIKALQTASATHATKTEVEAVSNRVTALETWHNNFTEVSEDEINSLFA